MAAARKQDRDAFDQLVAMHDEDLRRFVRRRVAAEEVEDLVQETWLSAWSSLAYFDGRGRFRTWLFGISLFKIKDHYRRKGRTLAEVPQEFLEDHRQMEKGYAGTELQESVRTLLESLSVSQKEVLELYYFSELTLAEIARILNRNLSTVKYQFYKAHAYILENAGELGDWRLYETNPAEVVS